jgi:23S rRNA (cytidine1920-2'-O)/16S rRNA (cytidine1409-2'-O)-methyltransferase
VAALQVVFGDHLLEGTGSSSGLTGSSRSEAPAAGSGSPVAGSSPRPAARFYGWSAARSRPGTESYRSRARSAGSRPAGPPGAALSFLEVKKRLDVLLVERGLAASRSQAQALVLAGRVKGHAKAGSLLDEREQLELTAPPRFVSRGGEKLAHALEALAVEVAGEECLDVGASTGGFADCLLQAGAARVCALDVGRGQLHERLHADPRVSVLEGVNVRFLDCDDLPFHPTFVTCDASFISIRAALPPALGCAVATFRALVLVKPQFEAGRAEAGRGVVRDPAVHVRVLRELARAAQEWGPDGCRVAGVCDSGLPGPKGNREFFLYLLGGEAPAHAGLLDREIDAAVGA